jgi:hypothetical protein
MGVPDFEGGWSTQPSAWRGSAVRQAAFAVSLAHVINEVKREPVCPLSVREIWAYWDERAGSPKTLKLAVVWGTRPVAGAAEGEGAQGTHAGWTMEQMKRESKDFWSACAFERDEGLLQAPFPCLEAVLRNKGLRLSLIYRDSRAQALPDALAREARMWRARRQTLREASGEVSDLLRSIGAAIAYAALPMPSRQLTLGAIREARVEGERLAREALAFRGGDEDAALEYDFACRQAGEDSSSKSNAVACMIYMQGFFMALGESPKWWRMAGGGEQEAFFGLLCRLEPKWGESLDAMQRSRLRR